jgi:protein regulator of cytokinesis 1
LLEVNVAIILQAQEKRSGTLKEQVAAIGPQLEELRRRKEDRARQFLELKTEIAKICEEIAGNYGEVYVAEEKDLTLRRLDEYHGQLATLQKEKVGSTAQVLL